MKGMLRENLRHHGRRYVATGVAVAISMAFVAICLCLTQTLKNTMTAGITDMYAGIAVVVEENTGATMGADGSTPVEAPDMAATADELQSRLPDVRIDPSYVSYAQLTSDSGKRATQAISTIPVATDGMGDIVEGTAPGSPTDIVLQRSVANGLEVQVGDTLEATDAFAQGDGTTPVTLTVSGLTEPPAMVGGMNYMSSDGLTSAFPGASISSINVVSDSPDPSAADQDALADRVAEALGVLVGADDAALVVRPAHTAVQETLAEANLNATMTMAIMLVFPAIAILVAAIVVSTTFQVVLHQRRRELALLRSLGATAKQVRSLIIRESFAIGALASLAGIVLGVLISTVAVRLLDMAPTWGEALQSAHPLQMLGVWVLGTLLTVVIGLRPARAVAKISPMAALQPVDEMGAAARRSHIVRTVIGVLLALAGTALIAIGLRSDEMGVQFGATFGGSLLALVGLVLIFWVLLPRITFAVMSPWRGVVARMARANAVRNPDRTASTGTAILIGVTLITTMLVGAASLRSTVDAELDSQLPYDLQVTSGTGQIPESESRTISEMEGVEAAAATRATDATASSGTVQGSPTHVIGYPDMSDVLRSDLQLPKSGEVYIPAEDLPDEFSGGTTGEGQASVAGPAFDGQTVTLCGPTGTCTDLTARLSDTFDTPGQAIVSLADLEAIAPDAAIDSVTLKLADDADLGVLQTDIQSLDSSLAVGGPVAQRQMIMQVIDIVLAVVVALLGVSVLVALVGVTNTLSLSVVERTHENGLLRALGLTRRQMGRMLNLEAIGISLSGALVGVAMGVLFGWLGLRALPLGVDSTILTVPWWQLLAVVGVSILAAIVASWVPGRRAARTSPVEALAHD